MLYINSPKGIALPNANAFHHFFHKFYKSQKIVSTKLSIMMDTCYQLRKIGLPSSVEKVKNCHQITSSTTLIGRGQAADIFLDSTIRKGLISRAHAQIIQREVEGGPPQYEIFDTSLNGTYVNDVRINGSVVLQEGDAITFGHIRGSLLKPGTHAPQKETEFLFRFENCSDFNKGLIDKNKLQNTKSSVFMSPKSPSTIVGENIELGTTTYNHEELSPPEKKIKYQTPNNANNRFTISDEEDFRQVIENATSKINTPPTDEASSDEGSFVINLDNDDQTPKLPLRNKNLLNHDSSYLNSKESSVISSSNSNDSDVETESESEYIEEGDSGSERSEEIPDDSSDNEILTERRLTNRRRSSKSNNTINNKNNKKNISKNSTKKGKNNLVHDKCASKNCKIATSSKKTVTWVQCDYCDAWYHVSCSGLKVSDVKKKGAMFNCGCSY